MSDVRWLTIPQFCAEIDPEMKPRQLQELARSKKLPAHACVQVGNQWRVRADLYDVMAAG